VVGIENPVHLLFIALVALVVLGPKRLPEVARALGKGVREFREAISAESGQPTPTHLQAQQGTPPPPPAAAAPLAQALAADPAPPQGDPLAAHAPVPDAPEPQVVVDPGQPVRSGDAPDRGPL